MGQGSMWLTNEKRSKRSSKDRDLIYSHLTSVVRGNENLCNQSQRILFPLREYIPLV